MHTAFCSASEADKQTLTRKSLDSSFVFSHERTIDLENLPGVNKAIVCPIGFRAAFAALFVLNYRLAEVPLSAVANRF